MDADSINSSTVEIGSGLQVKEETSSREKEDREHRKGGNSYRRGDGVERNSAHTSLSDIGAR